MNEKQAEHTRKPVGLDTNNLVEAQHLGYLKGHLLYAMEMMEDDNLKGAKQKILVVINSLNERESGLINNL